MMNTLTLLSFLVILTYTITMLAKDGVPYSISATYYRNKHKWSFQGTMFLTAGLLMPAILEHTPESIQFIAFLACAGMMIVGASPNFQDEFEGKVHATGATMVLIFSQIWVGFMLPCLLGIWLLYIGYVINEIKRHRTDNLKRDFIKTKPMFCIEVISIFTTYATFMFI